MGVTGLWTVVQPCARPIKIETLNRKRLAVDASIWIYQFLKAVRDKEGNALRNSHVVGFFRRICKLLFFGIKPVFVFDGGAPALKRQTISGRKKRREGRREDAVRTAGKLLALQMQRRAEEEEQKRKQEAEPLNPGDQEEPLPENLVYVDEIQMTQKERQQARKFRKRDAYHLPDLDASLSEMGGPNDPRIMSLEELQEYAQHFQQGEDINVYDFSKIDFDSPFFTSLPASDRYNILNAARLRSRLRMGYSKDQLDSMFPDRMAFSKFQVERVRERNELTQRLMNINGMVDDTTWGGARVAGEKGKEYILVRNEGVEGGWALGVVSDKDQGKQEKPIDVEELEKSTHNDISLDSSGDDDEFEDIPVEGLNRLPRRTAPIPKRATAYAHTGETQEMSDSLGYDADNLRNISEDNPDSLFISDLSTGPRLGETNDLFEEDGIAPVGDEDEQAQIDKAIAMSLQQNHDIDDPDDFSEVFQQTRADEPKPFTKGSGQVLARMANNRSRTAAPKTSIAMDSESEEEDIGLQIALAESKKAEQQSIQPAKAAVKNVREFTGEVSGSKKPSTSSGPLPFEALDLGSSLLGKKKMKKLVEENEGGFDKIGEAEKEEPSKPLPPWFSAKLNNDEKVPEAFDEAQEDHEGLDFEPIIKTGHLRGTKPTDAIDVDATESQNKSIIAIRSDEEDSVEAGDEAQQGPAKDVLVEDTELRMGDIADMARVEPPQSESLQGAQINKTATVSRDDYRQRQSSLENSHGETGHVDTANIEEPIEWSDSDHEQASLAKSTMQSQPAGGVIQLDASRSPSVEFEDVGITAEPSTAEVSDNHTKGSDMRLDMEKGLAPATDSANQEIGEALETENDLYSDPEDEDLLRQLAAEAEEHARFASSLNSSSNHLSVDEYERELRQLRNQQKKDRRDADEVTQVMITECQQLLRLFGLPYITAPMEAEAQCAQMVSLGLVDGIVTDDSDIFLFGGTRVYKNMFNQAKFVECYLSSDLQKEFDLDRQKLIGIAHLLGSDYTEGLPGVGPVTALEIISEFPSLSDFKEWWTGVQSAQIPKSADAGNPFRKKFRRQVTKLFLPPAFPDSRVDHAYFEPEVDSDPQPFEWGVPDLNALRSFLMATIGWSEERTDEVLVPVIKDMNRRQDEGTQANITNFFHGSTGVGAFAPRIRGQIKSKRLDNALGRMADEARKKRKASTQSKAVETDDDESNVDDEHAESPSDADEVGNHNGSKKRPRLAHDMTSNEHDETMQSRRRRVASAKRETK